MRKKRSFCELVKLLIFVIIPAIMLLSSCGYPDAGALEAGQWIGTIENPYQGMVSDNFYTWNGTNYVRIPSTGPAGATGATGATGAQGIQGEPGDDGFGQGCTIYGSSYNVTSGALKIIPLQSEVYDNDNMHDTSVNNTQIIIKTPGIYIFTLNIEWYPYNGGYRQTLIFKNSSSVIVAQLDNFTSASTPTRNICTCIRNCEIGDYYEAGVVQTSGTTLAVVYTASFSPYFSAQRIGN